MLFLVQEFYYFFMQEFYESIIVCFQLKYQMKSSKTLKVNYPESKSSVRRTLQVISSVNLGKQSDPNKLKISLMSKKSDQNRKPQYLHSRANSQMNRSINSMVLSKKMAELSQFSNNIQDRMKNNSLRLSCKDNGVIRELGDTDRQTRKLFTFCNVSVKQQQISTQNHQNDKSQYDEQKKTQEKWNQKIQNPVSYNKYCSERDIQSGEKILICKEQLRRFTQKFAKQKVQYEDKLQDYNSLKQRFEAISIQNADLTECLGFKQQECIRLQNRVLEVITQRDSINSQLFLMKKHYSHLVDSYQLKVKQHHKCQQNQYILPQNFKSHVKQKRSFEKASGLANSSNDKHQIFSITSQISQPVCAENGQIISQDNLVSLLKIQNEHLRRQYYISKQELQNAINQYQQKCQKLNQKIVILSEENQILVQKCMKNNFFNEKIKLGSYQHIHQTLKQNIDPQNKRK